MTDEWRRVDDYIAGKLIAPAERQAATLDANKTSGLPAIDVSPPQGKLLHLLAATAGARRILEIGALGGYSTIWLARALGTDGKVVTIEFDPRHAEIARANIAREGLASKVDLRVGAALDVLPQIEAEGLGPFDLTFIDADKANNAVYFGWALKLSRPGALIVVDNVVREGAVADPETTDDGGLGGRRLFDLVAAEPRVAATAIQTVGSKGWDGFLIARVKA
ncbi:O-methyltransferase [Methylocystis parvus]|uniref:O-methyltransferase n=1 Tax=Methylocystis parvus TaxID=134 RepID=A0A6B8M7P1_9HYPH|nr:O-methyltransferase [Methylocystis parvus]QGM97353.1 O-methyltransferase [Methylocystis parvus]WBJ98735.1 O-methyltransferase [Methylocystis parvus OBBP]